MSQISRRDFLKVAGTTIAGTLTSKGLLSLGSANSEHRNIIIIVCDALSARHLSLYGYPRSTTPNIDAFADRATVYHQHLSGGNFTTTGTASMLTGMYPWKHRAINQGGLVKTGAVNCNPYTLLGREYNRFAFTQNVWASYLLGQYRPDIDRFLSLYTYSLMNNEGGNLVDIFRNDHAISSIAMNEFLLPIGNQLPGTAIFGYLNNAKFLRIGQEKLGNYSGGIPRAMNGIPYLNEEIYHGVYQELLKLESEPSPYFAYFHLWSPHDPYRPRNDFRVFFKDDGYTPVLKPIHPFSPGFNEDYLLSRRLVYDRQIAQLDFEFGKLIEKLSQNGFFENSYLFFTSDHGELFERGFVGHGYQFMYEPVLHIPLIVHAPGQAKREDVFSLTSNIDILPTVLSITGNELKSDIDGNALPGLGGQVDENRPIFSMDAIENSAFAPIKKAVISMRKRNYKLIAYLGYENFDQVYELYDLENDPDELVDLSSKAPGKLKSLKEELLAHLEKANRLFKKK